METGYPLAFATRDIPCFLIRIATFMLRETYQNGKEPQTLFNHKLTLCRNGKGD